MVRYFGLQPVRSHVRQSLYVVLAGMFAALLFYLFMESDFSRPAREPVRLLPWLGILTAAVNMLF
jgi:cytochrome c oxidase subunit IV